jgi:hypothetical protein
VAWLTIEFVDAIVQAEWNRAQDRITLHRDNRCAIIVNLRVIKVGQRRWHHTITGVADESISGKISFEIAVDLLGSAKSPWWAAPEVVRGKRLGRSVCWVDISGWAQHETGQGGGRASLGDGAVQS